MHRRMEKTSGEGQAEQRKEGLARTAPAARSAIQLSGTFASLHRFLSLEDRVAGSFGSRMWLRVATCLILDDRHP
jgi:hypothetical protein